ncbi:hypothetical protein GGR55DRAFT_700718 [Xylaria sp. FL0064]|nr:hypothetical protein GGR55DRAFT_700718 [Xylaria sp. FL0064]
MPLMDFSVLLLVIYLPILFLYFFLRYTYTTTATTTETPASVTYNLVVPTGAFTERAKELESLRTAHAQQILSAKNEITAAQAATMASLTKWYNKQLEDAKNSLHELHSQELEALRACHSRELKSLKATYTSQMDDRNREKDATHAAADAALAEYSIGTYHVDVNQSFTAVASDPHTDVVMIDTPDLDREDVVMTDAPLMVS